ncbi:MAG: hypothetical protein II315_06375, partial [Rikenellaceae bacterium]|nr:hypothetical protein [Rikenellaceae bacterium]
MVAAANDAEKAYIAEKTANEQKSAAFKLTLEQSTVKATEVESEKARIQAEIEGISGGRDELSAKREEYSEKITEIKLQIIECIKDAESFAAMALSLEQAMSNRDERIAELEAEISKNNELIASRREDIANIEAAKEEIKNNIISSEESIAKFIEQRNDIEKQNSVLRSTEKEKTGEREKISGELARLTERKENMLAEYDNIIKQLYEEYQLTRTDAENMGIVIENPT